VVCYTHNMINTGDIIPVGSLLICGENFIILLLDTKVENNPCVHYFSPYIRLQEHGWIAMSGLCETDVILPINNFSVVI
jgi:hypothetical protein